MSGIIPIGRFRKKKEKEEREWREMDRKLEAFEKATVADTENHTAESVMRVMEAMHELNLAMANTPFGRQVAIEKRKRDEDFKKRYQEVFANAPAMPMARIKYFCGELLKLWPAVEEGGWEARRLAYDDFVSLYMEGVDRTLSDWCRRDQKTEEMTDEVSYEYPFQMLEVTKENMGPLLTETLGKAISICPEEGVTAKKEFLWELTRLFEICRGILYVFSDEVDALEAGS